MSDLVIIFGVVFCIFTQLIVTTIQQNNSINSKIDYIDKLPKIPHSLDTILRIYKIDQETSIHSSFNISKRGTNLHIQYKCQYDEYNKSTHIEYFLIKGYINGKTHFKHDYNYYQPLYYKNTGFSFIVNISHFFAYCISHASKVIFETKLPQTKIKKTITKKVEVKQKQRKIINKQTERQKTFDEQEIIEEQLNMPEC
jgi:hypothetical protein